VSRAPRRRSRQAALQALFAADLAPRAAGAKGAAAAAALDALGEHFEVLPGARSFAEELVSGVSAHREEIDARLAGVSQRWRLDRMAAVDRNVLRLGAYEVLFGGTPAAVAIDEAVELARRFGGFASPGFVNGVLDALARRHGPRAPAADAGEGQ